MFYSSKGKGVAMTEDEHNELVAEIQGLYSPPLQEPEFDDIDGGPHQPLPFPDDPRDDDRAAWEKEWINKTVGWLLDACEDPFDNQWLFQGTWYATEAECEAAIRAAIETPEPLA
jgi:hypothetical protein